MEKQKCPKIRFKGFDQNWIEKNFGDFSSVQMCRRIFKSETKTKDEVPFFKIGTFGSIPDAFISRELYQEYIDKYPYPEIGDVLISASGTIGRTVIYKGESAYYQDSNIIWLKLDKSKISNNFLLPFYALMRWNNIEGSTIKRLYNSDLLSTKISYPILSEQESIGVFFQNLDQSIALQEKKFAQTQNLKKAMLEKMFPKAGSTQPEIRLKGFSGDWDEYGLFNVALYKNGRSHESEVVEKGKYIIVNSKFISSDGVVRKFCDTQIEPLFKNDIVFVLSDVPNGKALSKAFLIEENEKYTLNQRIAGLTPKEEVDAYFLYILISRNSYFLKFDDGVGQTNLSLADMENFVALYPKLEEQKWIGQFFKQLDETLVLQQQQLQTLKNLKQAFLEKMFV